MLPPDAPPAAVLDTIRSLIGDDQVLTARRLAVEAAARFPDDDAIQNAKHILNDGKATPNPEVEPETGEELEWLSNPPPSAHGKWVALIGRQVVGMADTLVDLMASLGSSNLPRKPLIHHFPS